MQREFVRLTAEEERIGKLIVNAAFRIHKRFGPGLLEKIYEMCLIHELTKAGLHVCRQVNVPIAYDGIVFEEGLRLDILVEDKVIVEVKAVEQVNAVWIAQVLSYLRLTGLRLGYLMNFGDTTMRNGTKRIIL